MARARLLLVIACGLAAALSFGWLAFHYVVAQEQYVRLLMVK